MDKLKDAEWNVDDAEDDEFVSTFKSQFAVGFDIVTTFEGVVEFGLHFGFYTCTIPLWHRKP